MGDTAIVWFRRDLRLHDHPALHAATERFERVVCVFVLDDALLEGRYPSPTRVAFMLGCLRELDEALRERGGGLVVRHGPPERELPALARETRASAVLWTADVSPYARARDARVAEALDVEAVRMPGTYIVDDVTAPGTQQVYSPYFRRWAEQARREVLPAPDHIPNVNVPGTEILRCLAPAGGGGVPDPIRAPGERAGRAALDDWFSRPLDDYRTALRSSILSPYLRWGCISARECEARAQADGSTGARAWIRELAWRDFYAQTLLTHPGNLRHEQQERMRGLQYEEHADRLAAWKEGRTGFPFVDAGMRQLATQGWMPNRARLVAASLLTKELQLDWRAGEEHFARLLLDGEPAQNNGNWQWIAGVGSDPAPYFRRMYSPERHQERFDPDGA
ncbi:MAG TPA: deoxyribodipyrimidine photo-lyase [Solirubrobacteraceae bacterium]|jgi:deoxyribodipyrimidine photo-lyase